MENGKKNSFNILDFSLLRRIISLASPYKKQFYISGILAFVLAALSPVRPYLIQVMVDEHIINYNGKALLFFTLFLIGLLIVESVMRYYFSFLTSWLGQSVIKNLRLNVFNHLVNLRLKYFDNTPIGTSTTRTINDIEAINEIFSEGIITIIGDLLTLIAVIGIMFWTDWRLSLISLSTFPILLIATYFFKEGVKTTFNDVRTQVARLNAFLQEHISGMSIVQIFAAEKQEMDKFKVINKAHRDANIGAIWHYSVFFPVVEVVLAASIGLMVWWGAHHVINGHTSLGILIAFILYLNMLFRPIRMLADKFNTLQMGMIAAERVFKILDRKERIENNGTIPANNIKGEIAFENVWFAYNNEDYVLKNISFSLEAGKTLAIVGATGAGKSSIINILNRFYEINKGSIKADGTDIREYELYSLRKNIGLVLQDVFLFSGSVMDNITLRNENITRSEVVEAAKNVGAHDFIMRLPGQYDYNVMERGATLSMGQRQLISFIRALVFNPKILVLDEATSSIDTESELLIQNAIIKLVVDRTSIVIAHRLSTIQHAHKIMVLEKGEIKEIGSHIELLRRNGFYKKLYEAQLKKVVTTA